MTNEEQAPSPKTDTDFAQHITDTLKGGQPNPTVRVVPTQTVSAVIPQHIANNLLEFLRRVQVTGVESVAWVEAYQYVQPLAQGSLAQQQGVPFNGLPQK
jgi:hypothetical protein